MEGQGSSWLFDTDAGKRARDEELERVLRNAGTDWKQKATAIVLSMAGSTVLGEDIRLACTRRDVRPHHHNAWGGFVSSLVRDGILRPTGRMRNMAAVRSHGRQTFEYVVTRPEWRTP